MHKRATSKIMLTLLFVGMITLAFDTQSVKAGNRTIRVPRDYPTIQSAIDAASPGDTVYVCHGMYYENLYVDKDDLKIVGESKSNTIIDGGGGVVVKVYLADNVALSGFTVRNGGQSWYYNWGGAIVLFSAKFCSINDNIVFDSRYGITSLYGRNNTISGNTISNTNQGIPLYYSYNETVVENAVSNGVQYGSDPPYGIQVWGGHGNKIVDNTVTHISYTGIRLSSSATKTVVKGNTVENTSEGIVSAYGSFYYNTIVDNAISDTEMGIFFADLSSYNTVAGNVITNSSEAGIYFNYPFFNTIVGNTISKSGYGVHFQMGGSDNSVVGNLIVDSGDAIRLDYADKNLVSENNSTNNIFGITVGVESSDNTIEKNIASKNQVGILVLEHCDNNKFAFNKISNNGLGIITFESNNNKFLQNRITHSSDQGIHLVLSNNSIIAGNYVSNNNYGILLSMTKNNTIYHNDFIDNTNQVYLYQAIDTKWDDDYPSGGNYWSDYTYEDLYSGPAQGTPGSDGIWDLPYFIDADNQDRYPLVEPWTLSPTERIQQLIETIETWTLPTGTETCLTSKLDDAIHLLSIGNENGAIRNLTEFIHQVETLRNKKLEDDEADYLIAEAQRIIDLIEEQNP